MLRADGQQILVLAPHPDDETFGCGGTLRLLANAGAAIDVLYMTRGELGVDAPEAATAESKARLASTRTDEARAACRILGVRQVLFLDGRDGELIEQPQLADEICRQLATHDYTRIFCPWPQDAHRDHQATYRWLVKALATSTTAADVWLYEVWTPLRPTTLVPIDATIEAKSAAVLGHKSQLACLDYLSGFRGLAAYRALTCAGAKYAEAFQTVSRQQMLNGNGHG
jgi:LmbE family N-acetylglucosaminyl deacetylase